MSDKGFRVHILNPRKKTRRRKKAAKKAPAKRRRRNESDMAEANPKKKRRRRRKAAAAPKRRARRRRRRNPGHHGGAVARRRSNPSLMGGGIMGQVGKFLPALAGKLWVAWIVRRFGMGNGSMFGGSMVSPTAGTSWSMPQYITAIIATEVGAKFFGRFVNVAEFKRGAWDLILTKFVWTEGIARSQWAQQQFGTAPGTISYNRGVGQMAVYQGGRWNAMQGFGALVEKSPLDGGFGALVEKSPLDGTGDYAYGRMVPGRRAIQDSSKFLEPYRRAYGTRSGRAW